MTSRIKNLYDNLYKDNPSVFGDSSVRFLSEVLKKIQLKSGTALDVGVGDGATSLLLADSGFLVDAIDISDYAFSLIRENKNIKKYTTSILEFPIQEKYKLVNFPLVAHHINIGDFQELVKTLQNSTEEDGIHIYRLFTVNSDFYKNSQGFGFYDDLSNLNDLYKDWKIIYEEIKLTKSSVGSSENELREVVFQK